MPQNRAENASAESRIMTTPARPTVAVVIPTRDRPHMLGEAVDSVITAAAASDRHDTCEIIVVDNSSSAEATEAARRIALERGARFLQSSPAGVSRARNVGMAEAEADLISFLDDDDGFDPCFLDVLLQLHEVHPDAAVAFGRPVMCDDQLTPVYEIPEKTTLPSGDAFVFSTGTIVSWGSALADRRVLVDLGGFPEGVAQSEDWDLQMRVAAAHDFVGTNAIVQQIRQHDRGQVSHSAWTAYLRECQQVERKGLRLVGREGRQYLRRRATLMRLRGGDTYRSLQHALSAADRRDRGEAAKFTLTAVRRSPLHAAKMIGTIGVVLRRIVRPSPR